MRVVKEEKTRLTTSHDVSWCAYSYLAHCILVLISNIGKRELNSFYGYISVIGEEF